MRMLRSVFDKTFSKSFVYMYLTGNEKPDFRTICNFKKECKDLIEKLDKAENEL